MKEVIELNQTERQLILYEMFLSFPYQIDEVITYSDIRFIFGKLEKRTLQRDIRDLTDAGLLCVKYSKKEKGYIWTGKPTGKILPKKDISQKKMQHLKRLQRLAICRCLGVDNPIDAYFKIFPEASERMRQRDFETLRHIGYDAGYSMDEHGYIVLMDDDTFNVYDGYDIFIEDGKMFRYL